MKSFNSMEYLFEEILFEIFGYLNQQTLKGCRLVCKRWDELITNNTNLLQKHQMVFRTTKDFQKLSEIQRLPKNVVILDDQGFKMEVFSHFRNLHSLKIDLSPCYAYLEPIQFAEILCCVHNLKIFYISDINFDEYMQNMKDLKKAQLNLVELYCNSELINIIECSTLKVLNLRWHCSLSEQRKSNICTFLRQQKKLESLTLNRPNDFFDHFKHFDYEFNLNSFTFYSNTNFQDYDAFIRFLEPHKDSLKSLRIQIFSFEQSKTAIEEILKYVMRNLINLKELEIDTIFKGTHRKIEMLELQLSNRAGNTIERFGFSDILYSVDDNKQLIDMLPKMKHLAIKSCFCKVLELLEYAATKPQLESLRVSNFDCVASTVKFPNLKEFSVHTFSTSTQVFSSFISRNSKTLERISIGDATNMCQQTIKAISKCDNLKFLIVDVTGNHLASIMKTLYEILLRNKPLTVIFKDYPSSIKFELPGDKIFWDERIKLNAGIEIIHTFIANRYKGLMTFD